MNLANVEKIARAVLYEGYLLYPYRRSALKNQQRWNFGVLYPEAFSLAVSSAEPSSMQTECLVEAAPEAIVHVRVRFLHLAREQIPDTGGATEHPTERQVTGVEGRLGEIAGNPMRFPFHFAALARRVRSYDSRRRQITKCCDGRKYWFEE